MEWVYGGKHQHKWNETWYVPHKYSVASVKNELYYCILYIINNNDIRFLTKNLRISDITIFSNRPPDDCQFATKEEAIAICERHQRLIILQ